MPAYGDSLEHWAECLEQFMPNGQRDWSIDVAVHLGLALRALERLKAQGIDTKFKTHKLVESALQEAWREILFIRVSRIPVELLADVSRHVTLTRNGHIINGSDQTGIHADTRRYRNTNRKFESNTDAKSHRRRSGRGRRRIE